MAKRTDNDAASRPFVDVLKTQDPDRILNEVFARLEHMRLARAEATPTSAAQDRKSLERAIETLSKRVEPERLRRLTGLLDLIDDRTAEAQAAVEAVSNRPSIEPGGCLVMGRVRESDGKPAEGGQINFIGAPHGTSPIPKPLKIGPDGHAYLVLDARSVAEIAKAGAQQVLLVAQVGDRRVQDIAPAQIGPDCVHQFDLVLPNPKDSAAITKRADPAQSRPRRGRP